MNGRGLTGLANLGNTCFINSTIQCLSHTKPFNGYLNTNNYKDKLNKKPESLLLIEWDKLRRMMWSEDCTISPGGFIQAVQRVANLKNKSLFTGWAQNDLPEFLLFVIDCFHNSICRKVEMNITGTVKNSKDILAKKCYEMMQNMYKNEYSEVLKMFYGIHVSQICSIEGDVLSANPEPYFMIDLPIFNRECNIMECFDKYTEKERLDGDNKWLNEKTNKKETVDKGIAFWSFPDILVIDFKRFSNHNRKNQNMVHFPRENLDLTKYVVGYNKDSYKYDLYGICNHTGSVQGGHYFAYVKVNDTEWFEFNDTNVTKLNDAENKVHSPMAYCLFYKKNNN